jgi:hypothetical protein
LKIARNAESKFKVTWKLLTKFRVRFVKITALEGRVGSK